jgi:hypothetical protein
VFVHRWNLFKSCFYLSWRFQCLCLVSRGHVDCCFFSLSFNCQRLNLHGCKFISTIVSILMHSRAMLQDHKALHLVFTMDRICEKWSFQKHRSNGTSHYTASKYLFCRWFSLMKNVNIVVETEPSCNNHLHWYPGNNWAPTDCQSHVHPPPSLSQKYLLIIKPWILRAQIIDVTWKLTWDEFHFKDSLAFYLYYLWL